jgi:hypothetical protein
VTREWGRESPLVRTSLHGPPRRPSVDFRKRAKVREVKEALRRRMHDPIPSQGQWLRQVVTGFFAYHAVPTNADTLAAFRYHIMVLWMRTLTRRSQKDRTGWDRINKLADQWLPKPRILHPWPNQRFAVKHPRWGSRMRGALGEAGMSLPVQVWSAQSLASRTGASLTGVTVTWGPERRQWSDGVWD